MAKYFIKGATHMTQNNNIIIFDTTLRDGEQSPGCSMSLPEKLHLTKVLEELGVDVIEAGFPAASDGDFEAVAAIAAQAKTATIAALCRATERDILRSAEAVKQAKKPRIHTFIATSDLHMQHKLNMTRDQVLDKITFSVGLAKQHVADVEWSAEDASRTDLEFLCQAVETAIAAGATTINLPDTVGYALPAEYAAMFEHVIKNVPNATQAVFSTHCHNDLGLAVANSLAGVAAGARQIECTINGIGERAGNAALEEVVMALRTRHNALGFNTNIITQKLLKTSKALSQTVGFNVQPNKAIVGANAFAHESGIHQDGMLKNAQTYEIMTPESVGVVKTNLVLGKHSGRAAFKDKLAALGYSLSDDALNENFANFKTLCDQKKEVYDEDIIALLDNTGEDTAAIKVHALAVTAGTHGLQQATLSLEVNSQIQTTAMQGNGPVDAIFKAIRTLVPSDANLQLYQVHAVTGGTDALAEVTVRLAAGDRTVTGRGADVDTLVASAKAYVHALNKWQDVRLQRVHAQTMAA